MVLRYRDAIHTNKTLLLLAISRFFIKILKFRIVVQASRAEKITFGLEDELFGVAEASLDGLLELLFLHLFILLVYPLIVPIIVDKMLFPSANAGRYLLHGFFGRFYG